MTIPANKHGCFIAYSFGKTRFMSIEIGDKKGSHSYELTIAQTENMIKGLIKMVDEIKKKGI